MEYFSIALVDRPLNIGLNEYDDSKEPLKFFLC